MGRIHNEGGRRAGWFFDVPPGSPERPDQTLLVPVSACFSLSLLSPLPMYLGLMQMSDAVVRLALGDAWMRAASIVPFLCLRQLLRSPGCINESLLSVVRELKHRLPVTVFNVAVSLVVVVAVARFGLWQLAVAQCFTAGLALATSIRLQSRFVGVNWLEILKGIILLIAPPNLIMVVTVICIQRQCLFGQLPWLVTAALQVGVCALVYGSVLAVAVQLNRRQRWLPLG